MLYRVVEEVILLGSGVWQDCQSLPTRTLHQQVDLTLASKTTTTILSILSILSIIGSLSRRDAQEEAGSSSSCRAK